MKSLQLEGFGFLFSFVKNGQHKFFGVGNIGRFYYLHLYYIGFVFRRRLSR